MHFIFAACQTQVQQRRLLLTTYEVINSVSIACFWKFWVMVYFQLVENITKHQILLIYSSSSMQNQNTQLACQGLPFGFGNF